MDFAINCLWNGDSLSHSPMNISIQPTTDNKFVKVLVSGKFFNDPPAPPSPKGPTDQLWDYEVVEAFFLNSQDNAYLEVEFSPHGHYIVLLLRGQRNIIDKLLPLEYSATISSESSTWLGEALIPVDYFPPHVDMFNAFAIHGTDPKRQYEQLYPQQHPITHPDFHRLKDFRPIDFDAILPSNKLRDYSTVWKSKL